VSGCDSVVTTITTLLETPITLINLQSCNPENVGVDTVVLSATNGCDSLVITTTTLVEFYTVTVNKVNCDEAKVGTVIDTLTAIGGGCDSIVTTVTTLVEFYEITVFETTCDFDLVGTTIDTLLASSGCDSIVTTITTYLDGEKPEVIEITANSNPICEGDDLLLEAFASEEDVTYVWRGPLGNIISTSKTASVEGVTEANDQGVYTVVVKNGSGCVSAPKGLFVTVGKPTINNGIAVNTGPVCEGEDVQLVSSGVFGAQYTWYRCVTVNDDEAKEAEGVEECEEVGTGRVLNLLNVPANAAGEYKVVIYYRWLFNRYFRYNLGCTS
jgi:hypothetical protein